MKVVLPQLHPLNMTIDHLSPTHPSSHKHPNLNLSMQCSHLKMGSPTGLVCLCSLLPLLRDSLILMVGTVTSNTVPHNLVEGLLITNLLIVDLLILSPITTHLRVSRLRISLMVEVRPWWGTPHSIPAPLRDNSTVRLKNCTLHSMDSSGEIPIIKSGDPPRVEGRVHPRVRPLSLRA